MLSTNKMDENSITDGLRALICATSDGFAYKHLCYPFQ